MLEWNVRIKCYNEILEWNNRKKMFEWNIKKKML